MILHELVRCLAYTLAVLAIAHSAALFALRVPSNDVDSVHIAITSLAMDLMVLPMTYYLDFFGWRKEMFLISILLSIYIIVSNYKLQVCPGHFNLVDLNGKVYIITGANTGIGFQTARHLLSMGATVVIACRSMERAHAAKDALLKMKMPKVTPNKIVLISLDLCSFVSVQKFVKEFLATKLHLNGLINNAGVMMADKEIIKENGLETMFTANHLGHFLLTNLLIPTLKESRDSRIVNVSSSVHWVCKKMDFDNLMGEKSYSLFPNYGQSKLANILFTTELQRRLDAEGVEANGLTVNAVHPGLVLTEVTRNLSPVIRILYSMVNPVMQTVQKNASQGSYTSVYVATDPSLNGVGGKYFADCAFARVSPQAKERDSAKKLWEISEQLTGLNAQ